jgi:hypothetical protein
MLIFLITLAPFASWREKVTVSRKGKELFHAKAQSKDNKTIVSRNGAKNKLVSGYLQS